MQRIFVTSLIERKELGVLLASKQKGSGPRTGGGGPAPLYGRAGRYHTTGLCSDFIRRISEGGEGQ